MDSGYKEKSAALQHKGENIRFSQILSTLRITFISMICTVLINSTENIAVGDVPGTSQADAATSNRVEILIARDPDV